MSESDDHHVRAVPYMLPNHCLFGGKLIAWEVARGLPNTAK